MAWDDEKQVAPGTEDGELTPEEWNEHVADQKNHSERHESNGDDELSVEGLSGDLADEQDAKPHDIGGPTHTADTLANLNSKVSDATLDDSADPREPEAHAATHEGGSDSLNVFNLTGDLVGEGLERVNDTLQVLSSIWDGTNVVADVENTNTTTQALEAESVSTEELVNDRLYAGAHDGSDPDARLDNTLSTASDGDVIYLENAVYGQDRTINTAVMLCGTFTYGTLETGGTEIVEDVTWTLNTRGVQLLNVSGQVGSEIVLTDRHRLSGGYFSSETDITVQGDRAIITEIGFGNVTFESGTADGIIDSCVGTSVIDNGNNFVGDIA